MTDYIDRLDEAGKKATAGIWYRGTKYRVAVGEASERRSVLLTSVEGDTDFVVLARNVWPELVAVVRAAHKFHGNINESIYTQNCEVCKALAALAATVTKERAAEGGVGGEG